MSMCVYLRIDTRISHIQLYTRTLKIACILNIQKSFLNSYPAPGSMLRAMTSTQNIFSCGIHCLMVGIEL